MKTMASIHSLSPFALELNLHLGPLHIDGIRWYGLAYLMGFLCGYGVIRYLAKKGNSPITLTQAADFTTYVAVGTLIGGRLGYCIFYGPNLFTEWTSDFPFWGVLKVHQGGMASHGGIMGIAVVCWLFARAHKLNPLHLLDLTVVGGSLGIFFGRLANYVNGELFGREAPPSVTWAVKFPQEMYLWGVGELSKLKSLEPAAQILGSIRLRAGETMQITPQLWNEWVQDYPTGGFGRYAIHQVIEQIVAGIQNKVPGLAEAVQPMLTPRYPSQLIQAGLEGLLVFLILAVVWLKPRKPGVIAATFGVCYAVARIIGEQFRMPDAQLGFQALGLTRGQWLSVVMLVAAIAFLVYAIKRPAAKLGGWLSAPKSKAP